MDKICPLFFSSSADLDDYVCRPDRCAWAYNGGCALVMIADALAGLKMTGIDVITVNTWSVLNG